MVPSTYATLTFPSVISSSGGAAVDATAAISISGSTMTVTLTDLQQNPGDVASVLNGIAIAISGATGASGFSASDATIATIAGDGSYTSSTATGATIVGSAGWSLSGTSTITLQALGGQSKYLILGPDANGNFTGGSGNAGYTGANSSIAGYGPHNPFILGNETFQFTLLGTNITEASITGFTFGFGTSSDTGGGTIVRTSVPEPTTVVAGALR